MRINHTTILLFILLLMNACVQPPALPVEVDEYANYLPDDSIQFSTFQFDVTDTLPFVVQFAMLERQKCYGTCPEYVAKFYDDGTVTFKGIKDVEWIGAYQAKIDLATIQRIVNFAERVDYFRLANYYPTYGATIDEVPTTVTSVQLSYKSNAVTNKHHSPAQLHKFERFLDDILFNLEWKPLQ